jgi:hypothetical protein
MTWSRSVSNCKPEFKFRCPKQWDDLARTADQTVRFCQECKENVYLTRTDAETLQRARAGQCVARLRPQDDDGHLLLGEISPEYEAELAAEHQRAQREKRIEEALLRLPGNSRPCPKCGFPEDAALGCTVCAVPT